MSQSIPLPLGDLATIERFPSIVEIEQAHDRLLAEFDDGQADPARSSQFWDETFLTVQRIKMAGALLDSGRDRRVAQSILDFWSSALYRANRNVPPLQLDRFDPELAPDVKEKPCPYRGLAAFRERDADYFFGRDALLQRTLGRLKAAERFLAVVGESGSGKSSFVLAGLLPALKSGAVPALAECRSFTMVPGSRPLENLGHALLHPDPQTAESLLAVASPNRMEPGEFEGDPASVAKLLGQSGSRPAVIVVDQFEELFTLCQDVSERTTFIQQLLAIASAPNAAHVVILTMRTDYLDQVVKVPGLKRRFDAGRVEVDALDINELRAAIEGPAAKVGLRFEEGIVDDLVTTILGERAGLPLLQFALQKLWDRCARNRITKKIYQEVGNPRKALGRAADALYQSLIPQDQATARRILLRMVRPGEGLEVTSNRIPRAEVFRSGEAADRVERVLERLVKSGLVKATNGEAAADAQIEVAHEALIRNWSLIQDWLAVDRVELRRRRGLTYRAHAWKENKASLLRGQELVEAGGLTDLNALEQEFVEASRAEEMRQEEARETARQKELQTLAELARVQQERAVLLRRMLFCCALVGLMAVGFAVVARVQYSRASVSSDQARIAALRAQDNARLAEAAAQRAHVNALTAHMRAELARTNADISLVLLLGLEAVRITKPNVTAEAYATLAAAVDESARSLSTFEQLEALSPAANSRDASVGPNVDWLQQAQLSPPATSELPVLRGHTNSIRSVAYSPDGRFLVTGSADQTGREWESSTGREIVQLRGHTGPVLSVACSPDGKFVVTGSGDKTAVIWEAATGRAVRRLEGHTLWVQSVACSSDGRFVATGSGDHTARVWDLKAADPTAHPLVLAGPGDAVTAVVYSPNGRFLAIGSRDKTARVCDLQAADPTAHPLVLIGPESGVTALAYSPDGRLLAIGSHDNKVRICEVATGRQSVQLDGHIGGVESVAYSPDGRFIATASKDTTARIWDPATGRELRRLDGHAGSVESVAYSLNGRYLVTASSDTTARVWPASIDALMDIARQRISRVPPQFTPAERTKFRLDDR